MPQNRNERLAADFADMLTIQDRPYLSWIATKGELPYAQEYLLTIKLRTYAEHLLFINVQFILVKIVGYLLCFSAGEYGLAAFVCNNSAYAARDDIRFSGGKSSK